MVRPADGVDLGLWSIDPARLLVPVDVHLHRLGRNLGFTSRPTVTWDTAEDITRALARFDASDPTKYDFALCHMGMLQRCPSRQEPELCSGCGVKPVCVHWERSGSPEGATARVAARHR
jgi:endonuclease III